jgi:MSHA biogenesis protein MshL
MGRQVIISPETGIIAITAFEDQIHKIAKFIETYEGSAHRQVWIEAKILEVNLHKSYQMGIDWGVVANRGGYYGTLDSKRTLTSPAMAFTAGDIENQSLEGSSGVFQFAVSNNVLDVMLDAIARQGNLKVLASPRITALNNEKAVIRVVREEAFFNLQTQISQGIGGNVTAPTINVQVVPIGIVMDIIPQISDDGYIMLSINPDISELLETRRFEVQGAMATQPVIDRRSIDTTAKLRNGQSLVIAGIIKERKNEILKGVPLLYKLPLLGNLFRRTEQRIDRTELVILITPRLHSGKSAQELTLKERQRIRDSLLPMRLGDSLTIEEGLKGEVESLKKKKKQEEN